MSRRARSDTLSTQLPFIGWPIIAAKQVTYERALRRRVLDEALVVGPDGESLDPAAVRERPRAGAAQPLSSRPGRGSP